jgi:hypothetical protein
MTENISLSSFCKTYELSKGSVHKFLKGEGFDTSHGLTPDMVKAASAYFLHSPTEAAPTITPEIVVGNHRSELALPSQPTHIDLPTYRGEHAALTSFQPEDISRFLESCDGFLDAVEADFAHQQAITQQKEQAAALVKAKVDAVKQASLIYQVRSEALSLHNRSLDAELQQGMSVLGKPQTPANLQP